MTERELEARRADIIDEIRALPENQRTVRSVGHAVYSRARRAFGSWNEALRAAGLEDNGGFGDPTAIFKNVDAISPNPLPGLPSYMRQRQILGGRVLERFARDVGRRYGADALARVAARELARDLWEALEDEMDDWHAEYGQQHAMSMTYARAALSGDGTIAIHSEESDVSGDIELPNRTPVDHGRR